MHTLTRSALALVAVGAIGCGRSTPLAPGAATPAPSLAASANAAAAALVTKTGGKPEIDPTYANGETVYMIGPHMIVDAKTTMPEAYAHAEELYLVVFPQDSIPQPGAGPIVLPSGYRPQCDPCFHPGLPAPFVYHDHVITGAPGMGNNGTAGEYKAPWKIILLMYRPDYAASPNFVPLKSESDIDAAERAGNVFVPINGGAANPYEIETGNLLICPTVSNHA